MSVSEGKILVTPRSFRRVEGAHWDKLRSSPFEIVNSPHKDELMTEEEMINYVSNKNIKGIIVGLDPLTEEVFNQGEDLKVVAKYGTGLDNIDIEAARKEGVALTFTPGANTQSVADLAMGLMLGVARWISTHDRSMREGKLDRKKGREVWKKSLGIVGLGHIGTAVARRARGFNMKTYYYDSRRKELEETALGVQYRGLEELVSESDFLTLHCPLTKKTENIIGKAELKKMKEGAILINTARSGLVDEEALLNSLQEGIIGGAAIDTFESKESLDTDLLQLDNFIGSPHAGASTRESVLRMANMATQEILDILGGKEPIHPVPRSSDG